MLEEGTCRKIQNGGTARGEIKSGKEIKKQIKS
jgi:hypothetical protein